MPRLLRPETVSETLGALADGGDGTKLVAGGTAVMLMVRAGLLFPEQLVALDHVRELDYVAIDHDMVRLGALTTLRDLERSGPLAAALPTLASAIALVANHRVRRRATIGGCLSEADYASDPPAVLQSLGARVRLRSVRGEREVPLADFLVGYYETVLEHDELLTEVTIPRPAAGVRTAYLKYVTRSVEDRPCIGVAAYVDADDSGRARRVRVAVAGATPTPFMLGEVVDMLGGAVLDADARRAIGDAYQEAIKPLSDVRGSASYRRRVTGRLVTRALETALSSPSNSAFRL